MDSRIHERIRENLSTWDTKELIDIWENGLVADWNSETFEIIKTILLERLGVEPKPSIPRQIEHYIICITQHIESFEWEQVFDKCSKIAALKPEDPVIHFYQAQAFYGLQNYQDALHEIRLVIKEENTNQEVWEIYRQIESDLDSAFKSSSCKLDLDNALELFYDGEVEKAEALIEIARKDLPDIAPAYNFLGLILQEMGQVEAAEKAYLKSISLNPQFFPARENLASARIQLEGLYFQKAAEFVLSTDDLEDYSEKDLDNAAILDGLETLPEWFYLEELAYRLNGWPGYRNSQGRFGTDPLSTDFEHNHIQGVMLRKLFTGRMRTRNPAYMFFMFIASLIHCFPLIFLFAVDEWIFAVLIIFGASPVLFIGALLFLNLIKSLIYVPTNHAAESGSAFY